MPVLDALEDRLKGEDKLAPPALCVGVGQFRGHRSRKCHDPWPMAASPKALRFRHQRCQGRREAVSGTRPKRLKRAPQSPWEIVDDHDQIVDDHDQEEQQCVHPDHDMHTRLVLTPGCADSGICRC